MITVSCYKRMCHCWRQLEMARKTIINLYIDQYQHYHLRQRPHNKALIPKTIGADCTGATGNFAPVLTQEPGQMLRFAPVPFMAVL